MYTVLMHNDDYTTMEFVVLVLVKHFRKSPAEAAQVMDEAAQQGDAARQAAEEEARGLVDAAAADAQRRTVEAADEARNIVEAGRETESRIVAEAERTVVSHARGVVEDGFESFDAAVDVRRDQAAHGVPRWIASIISSPRAAAGCRPPNPIFRTSRCAQRKAGASASTGSPQRMSTSAL